MSSPSSSQEDPQPSTSSSVSIADEETDQCYDKRRPDSRIVPLVLPTIVKRSSKDPNRGLYPKCKPKVGTFHNAPSFTKASDVYKGNRLNGPSSSHSESQKPNRLSKRKAAEARDTSKSKVQCSALGKQNKPVELMRTRKRHKYDDGDASRCTLHSFHEKSQECNEIPESESSEQSVDEEFLDEATNAISSLPEMTSACHNAENYVQDDLKEYSKVTSDSEKTAEQFLRTDDFFGLFGSSGESYQEDAVCYFERLPIAVIEQILCQVPFRDLMNFRFVCKAWNNIISDNRFVEWKKAYYRMKLDNNMQIPFEEVQCQLPDYRVKEFFIVLIRFMMYRFNRRPAPEMTELLKTLPKYRLAVDVIAERLPHHATKGISPWAVIAMLVLLSRTVWDIMAILKCLCYNGSPCLNIDVIDAMYCIATFLLFFKNNYKINHGLHYRVYYALYLWENSASRHVNSFQTVAPQRGIVGQQSIHAYCKPVEQRLTFEQMRILNHRLQPDQVVKIVAFAGSGKTTTLIHYARLYPQLKFLNVVFNKGVNNYASKNFPSNVECRTAHSLAYQAIGKNFKHKLAFKIKPHDIMAFIKKPEGIKVHIFTYARCVLQTLESFMSSADELITIAHVPLHVTSYDRMETLLSARLPLTDQERLYLRQQAENLWGRMIDPDDRPCKITHDTYLKMFQLSKPKFHKYNCIMIDEAQDCNAAMLDIMLSQNVPVILVGDPHQQIYGFRGANNALESVHATHVYPLTKSFRFGPEIAYVASCCIEVLKGNVRATVVGSEKDSFVNGHMKGQYAVIARTNFRLFEEAVRLCCTSVRLNDEPDTVHAAFAGGIQGYGFDQLIDIHRLASGESLDEIKDRFIKRFSSFRELVLYAKRAEDAELQGKIDIVTQYNHKILEYIETIKKKGRCAIELANVVFSTAHKAKGLEFDTVCLADDFRISNTIAERPSRDANMSEEYNILYVALTRAKKCLLMCDTLSKVLFAAQEKFEYPVSSKELLGDLVCLKCVKCYADFTPHTVLTAYREASKMATGRKIEEGPLCVTCGTASFYRPEVHRYPAVMILDPVVDNGHFSMSGIIGPLPADKPDGYDCVQDDLAFLEQIGMSEYIIHMVV